jgi:hypothetical protein
VLRETDPQAGLTLWEALRLLYLNHRYQLGYESLCREVADSIGWRRFCPRPGPARPASDHAGQAGPPRRT